MYLFSQKGNNYDGLPGSHFAQSERKSRPGSPFMILLVLWNTIITLAVISCIFPMNSSPYESQGNAKELVSTPSLAAEAPVFLDNMNSSTTELVALPLESPVTALETRQENPVRKYVDIGLRVARYSSGPALGFGIWGLVGDCTEWSEDITKAAEGVKCVLGAIGTALAGGLVANSIYQHGGEAWGKLKDIGLVWLNGKRDLETVATVEDSLSIAMRSEVRYIGDWSGTVPGGLAQRDLDGQTRSYPVFGAKVRDTDVHFAYMGDQHGDNTTIFRLGFGPGPVTEENNRRLGRRNVKFNDQHFSKGGLDIKSERPSGDGPSIIDPTRQEDFDWIYDQVKCYMTNHANFGEMPLSNGMWEFVNMMMSDVQGFNYQMLNKLERNTIIAGAIAPFGADGKGSIGEMGVIYGIVPDSACTDDIR